MKKNKAVEKFLLKKVYKKENVKYHECLKWLSNYYQEIENEYDFSSEDYNNQDSRIDDMFPGMPEAVKNLIKLKAYKHRSDHHGEKDNDDRIKELEESVSKTVYAAESRRVWWLP